MYLSCVEDGCNWKSTSFQRCCCHSPPGLCCAHCHDYFFDTQEDKTSLGRVCRNIYFQHSILTAKVHTYIVGQQLEYFTVKLCLILQQGTEKEKPQHIKAIATYNEKAGKCHSFYVSI